MITCTLWLDPGETTGLAWVSRYGFQAMEGGFKTAGLRIAELAYSYRRQLMIGWEHYTITAGTPQNDAYGAIEMIGVARYCAMSYSCQIAAPSMPGDRSVFDARKLKVVGWYEKVRGHKDAMSAAQHLGAYLLRHGGLPAAEQGKLIADMTNLRA